MQYEFSSSWVSGKSSFGIRLNKKMQITLLASTPGSFPAFQYYSIQHGNGPEDDAILLPHVPVEVYFVAKEEVDEAGDVLLRTVGIGKANVIEGLDFGCM